MSKAGEETEWLEKAANLISQIGGQGPTLDDQVKKSTATLHQLKAEGIKVKRRLRDLNLEIETQEERHAQLHKAQDKLASHRAEALKNLQGILMCCSSHSDGGSRQS